MISWGDLYNVLSSVVPLYVVMILAYGSVRWWKILSPDQCAGINRFVAIFVVPLFSFHFISTNNPYAMNLRFIAADTIQKIAVLVALGLWAVLAKNASFDWMITLFSLSTLPNTLVMGVPLLTAMYGRGAGSLMVQIVVLQCAVWYTLLMVLFECRGAKMLIMERFPDTAASIVSFKVDSDVVSLDGRDFLETDAGIGDDGKLRVTVRKSSASRQSNLTGAEIYSLNSGDFYDVGFSGGRLSSFGPADSYYVRSRPSNFEENSSRRFGFYPAQTMSSAYPAPNPELSSVPIKTTKNHTTPDSQPPPQQHCNNKANHNAKELHMFVFDGNPTSRQSSISDQGAKEIRVLVADHTENVESKEEKFNFRGKRDEADDDRDNKEGPTGQMPPKSVMIRLLSIMVWRKLIRNPNTYSYLIGLIWSLVSFRWHVEMPKIISQSISILSDAGLGMAMFSLGLFMALQPKIIACGNSVAAFSMAVRFLTGPAVMAAASVAIGLRGTLLHIAIVQAALPQAIVPFVFAKEYNVHASIQCTAVIFGMLVALPITLVYYVLLGL